ncbi:unnamed protein product [Didymodactylos carnosus]|uniref:Uncharacterized protein n=1 Tax=Didymodactylos carnosus TaxID=1234261 RepID=A0A814B8Z0_9BILA|nr:unnamed protein product [Didymodactylos carnosus]CAF3702716.1 unnamed protein product [Didymodactylos carnosus]
MVDLGFHGTAVVINDLYEETSNPTSMDLEESVLKELSTSTNNEATNNSRPKSVDQVTSSAVRFIINLRKNRGTEKLINDCVKDMFDLFIALQQDENPDYVHELKKTLSTKYRRDIFMKLQLAFVEPKAVLMGRKMYYSRKRKHLLSKHAKGCYLPFLKTLKSLLQQPAYSSMVIDSIQQDQQEENNTTATSMEYEYCEQSQHSATHSTTVSQSAILNDLTSGCVARNDIVFRKQSSLKIILYYDDVEISQPLKKRKRILSVFYWTMVNIPRGYLWLQCFTEGFLISMKKLYGGIEFIIQNQSITLNGGLFVLWGNLLALVGLHGFKMGFKHAKSPFDLRTMDTYQEQCAEIETTNNRTMRDALSKQYGIIQKSLLCGLPGFNIFEQSALDVAHVFLEVDEISISQYGDLMKRYLQIFDAQYGWEKRIPKKHFSLHLQNQFSALGPARYCNTLSFERKHQAIKASGRRNFVNTAFTAITNYINRECSTLFDDNGNPAITNFGPKIETKKLKTVDADEYGQILQSAVFARNEGIERCVGLVIVDGIEYKTGVVQKTLESTNAKHATWSYASFFKNSPCVSIEFELLTNIDVSTAEKRIKNLFLKLSKLFKDPKPDENAQDPIANIQTKLPLCVFI